MTESTELQAFKRQKDGYLMNSKSGKIYLIATLKYTSCAYLLPPLTGINHYHLQKNLTKHPYLVYL